jgi:hypothetical protein
MVWSWSLVPERYNEIHVLIFWCLLRRTGESVAVSCEHGNEPSVSIKCGVISWLVEWLLASPDELRSLEFVCYVLIFYLAKGKGKVVPVLFLTERHSMKAYWGSGGIAPRILYLGTRWRWAVSFTPRPLYPQGKSPWCPLDRRLGGPQSRSGCGSEEKNSQQTFYKYTCWNERCTFNEESVPHFLIQCEVCS